MRLGQFLFTILLALVLFALIGIIDWSTVGDWALIMLILALLGPVLLIISYLVFKVKDNSEVINRRLGIFFNWMIVISGIVIFILTVSYQSNFSTSNIESDQPHTIPQGQSKSSVEDGILPTDKSPEINPEKVDSLNTDFLRFANGLQKLFPEYNHLSSSELLIKLHSDPDFFSEVSEKYFTLIEPRNIYELRSKDPEEHQKVKDNFRKNFKADLSNYMESFEAH